MWFMPSVIVVVVLLAVLPVWPHSRGWTWVPAGMVGMIAAIVLAVTAVERLG